MMGLLDFCTWYAGVTHAGLAVVAADTGRVLLAQRAYDETDDADVQETWEFPGGGLEGSEGPEEAAFREFSEEIEDVGLSDFAEIVDGWRAPSGVYQGFVVRVPDEGLTHGESPSEWFTPNDEVQAVRWFSREDVESLDNLRPEMADTPWDLIFGSVSGNEEDDMDEAQQYAAIPIMPIPVHGIVAPEGSLSGDRRGFSEGALTKRPLRLPFRDTATDIGAHGGAFVVGSVDRLMRADGMIHWEGLLMPAAQSDALVEKMAFFGGRYGVSVDGDQGSVDTEKSAAEGALWFDQIRAAGLTAVDIPAFHEAHVAFGYSEGMPSEDALVASAYETGDLIGGRVSFDRGPGWITDPKATKNIHDYWTKKGEEGYAKVAWGTPGDFTRAKALIGEKIAKNSPGKMKYLNQIIAQWHHDALGYWPGDLDKPGNKTTAEARAERKAKMSLTEGAETQAEPPEGIEMDSEGHGWEAVLVSSVGAPVRPPISYFHRHKNTGALVIEDPDEHGIRRVHGWAAQWGVCHVGMNGECVEPPRTYSDDYPDFHLGRTATADGPVPTGVLTYGVGHRDAETILSESPEQAFFDNLNNAWAAVRVGEDEVGIWFSGVVLSGVPEDHLVKIQASGQVSGEWLAGEMRACLTVNVPGYPVHQPTVAYDDQGNVLALAASAFGQRDEDSPCTPTPAERMAALQEADAAERFEALRAAYEALRAAYEMEQV